jgi:hypothetical protein
MASTKGTEPEERLAEVQEETEQRMHSVADLLPNSEKIHERANDLSDRAEEHRRRVQQRRADDRHESDG